MKKVFISIILIFNQAFSFSQNAEVDSLLNVFNTAKEDTTKVKSLYLLSEVCDEEDIFKYASQALSLGQKLLPEYSGKAEEKSLKKSIAGALNNMGYVFMHQGSPDSAITYYQKSLKITKEIGDMEGTLTALVNMSGVYLYLGKADSALQSYSNVLSICEQVGDKERIANAHYNIGRCYHDKGKTDIAIEQYIKALKGFEEIGDQEQVATAMNNIGMIYNDQGRHDKAFDYLFKGLAICEEIRNNRAMIPILVNLSAAYQMTKDYKKELEYLNRVLKISQELGDKPREANILINIAANYLHDSLTDEALAQTMKANKIQEEINDKQGLAFSLHQIGRIYLNKKEFSKAIEYGIKALQISRGIKFPENIKRAAHLLADAYSSVKDYKNAYEYHQLYSQMKDTLLNEESSKQITEMQTKYDTEKKEQQITLLNKDKELQDAQLNRQKIIIWSVVGGLLVVFILSIFIFRERRKSEKLLLNILPAETAKELKRNGKATARHYESVTVMFTDFKGFTTIAEKLSAEELVSELDFLFRKFDEIISKYPIEKIKTIGDAYMCAGGLPTANNTNAMDVVSAAIEIQSWMTAQNNKWQLRIGIHTGAVTAGVVGDKKFAYDIWGDTVNTASRMESSGEAGKINISETTYAQISPLLEERGWGVRQRGKIPAKNKREIEMYFIEKS